MPYRFLGTTTACHILVILLFHRLSRARRVVENAFGILSHRWPMELERPQVIDVVKATVVLHNFLCRKRAEGTERYLPAADLEQEEGDSISFGIWRREGVPDLEQVNFGSNRAGENAKKIRDLFCYLFNNAGAVPWQNQMIFAVSCH